MKNMRILREEKGLSQKDLARLLNITQQSVYKYESGQACPNPEVLREMSQFFNTSIDYLLDNNEQNSFYNQNYLKLTVDEYELVQNYRQLPGRTRKVLRNMSYRFLSSNIRRNHEDDWL